MLTGDTPAAHLSKVPFTGNSRRRRGLRNGVQYSSPPNMRYYAFWNFLPFCMKSCLECIAFNEGGSANPLQSKQHVVHVQMLMSKSSLQDRAGERKQEAGAPAASLAGQGSPNGSC